MNALPMSSDAKRLPKRARAAQRAKERLDEAEMLLQERLALLWRIHALSYVMTRRPRADPALHSGLSLVAWRIVLTLANAPDLSANEITALWGLEKMGVNRAVNELLSQGFVVRDRDPDGGRRIPLRLTEAGRELHDTLWPGARHDYRRLADALTEEELTIFNRAADRLLRQARMVTD